MTEAEYQQLLRRKPQTLQRKARRRPGPVMPRRHTWPGIERIDGGYRLTFMGKLPNMNKERPDWRQRWALKQACLRQFGILPSPATQFAEVAITRILGPRERLMDEDNLIYALKGVKDSLTNRRVKSRRGGFTGGGNYIIDDRPDTVRFLPPVQDATRRQEGPKLDIRICYLAG